MALHPRRPALVGARHSRRVALPAVIPGISQVMVWTNHWHGLMRHNIRLDSGGPFAVVAKDYGARFYVLMTHNYLVLLLATFLILRTLVGSRALYRMQGLVILAGVLLLMAANLSYVAAASPVPRMDLTPPAFALSGLLLFLGIYRFRVLELIPLAHDRVVDSIADGVIIFDPRGRIVDLNPAAASLLGRPIDKLLGADASEAAIAEPSLRDHLLDLRESRNEVATGGEQSKRYFHVSTSAIRSSGRVEGWVTVLRDITDRRKAEEEREALIHQLQETMAQVKTLRGLIPICASCKKVRDDRGYWHQVDEYVRAHSEVEFSHSICPECMARLYPDYQDGE